MAAKSKCFGIFSYSFCISALFLACLTYIYINWVLEINNCLRNEDDWRQWRWREYFNWFSITDDNIYHCNLWLWKTHQNAISKTFQRYADSYGFTATETYLSILFGVLLISNFLLLSCLCCRNKKTIPIIPISPEVKIFNETAQILTKNTQSHFDFRKCILVLFFTTLAVSVPWEFVRLYQREVSKRAASVSLGAPEECSKRSNSVFQSITIFLQWQFSWSHHDKCEAYYYHLLVDPLWELTPLLVISSALTRCLLQPIELFFSGMGRSFRAFFVEIPAQWQPVLLVILTFIMLVLMLMTCSYRLHIPLLFKIEPKTPVYMQDCSHRNTNQNSAYLTNGNVSYISSPNQNSSYMHSRALTNGNDSYSSAPNQNSSYMHSRALINGNDSYSSAHNQNSSYMHSRALTNGNDSDISTPNQNSSYLKNRTSENRANGNISNMCYSLNDVPNKTHFNSRDYSHVDDKLGNSGSHESVASNVTKKRKYTKKIKENVESNATKAGSWTPKTKSTRAYKSRKSRYEDDPDFVDDL